MANPQIENGHTRIANEILNQVMKTNLNGTQFRLVMAIWRYTYGFQRKSHEMSVSYLAELINTSRSHADRELKALIDRNIIKVIEIGQKGARVLSFNKNYKEWNEKDPADEPVPDIPKPKKKAAVKKEKYSDDNAYFKMAKYFYKRVEKVAADAGISHLIQKSNLQTWADDMRKLIEIDGVDKRLAKQVMDWVTQDEFWKTNILSAKKLRQKFMELAIKMKTQQNPQPKQQQQPDSRDKEIEFQKWIAQGGEPSEFNWNG